MQRQPAGIKLKIMSSSLSSQHFILFIQFDPDLLVELHHLLLTADVDSWLDFGAISFI